MQTIKKGVSLDNVPSNSVKVFLIKLVYCVFLCKYRGFPLFKKICLYPRFKKNNPLAIDFGAMFLFCLPKLHQK